MSMIFAEISTGEFVGLLLGAGGIGGLLTYLGTFITGLWKGRADKYRADTETDTQATVIRMEAEREATAADTANNIKIETARAKRELTQAGHAIAAWQNLYEESRRDSKEEIARLKEDARADVADLKTKIDEVHGIVDQYRDEHTHCREELAAAKAHIADLERENAALTTRIAVMELRVKALEDSSPG